MRIFTDVFVYEVYFTTYLLINIFPTMFQENTSNDLVFYPAESVYAVMIFSLYCIVQAFYWVGL